VVDEYSFNVPLIIHAPKANVSGLMTQATSHIDILPSLMDLMGVPYPKNIMQGRSVYLPPVERTIFFNANYYLGADAFHYKGTFYSINHSTGEIHLNPERLYFKHATPISLNDKLPLPIQKTVQNMYSFQNYWQKYFFENPNSFTTLKEDR
jgi:arylsulfatase A-like enzyme